MMTVADTADVLPDPADLTDPDPAADPAAEFVQPITESEVRECKPDETGEMVVTQVTRIITVDEGENGTWRDSITLTGDDYQEHLEKGTLDAFVQEQADERYRADLERRNAPVVAPPPPTPEEQAALVTAKQLEIVGLGEEYAGIASRYVQMVRELLALDDSCAIPPLPVPTALTPPELDVLKEEAEIRERIVVLDAQIAEAERGG